MLKILCLLRRLTWSYINLKHPVGFKIVNDIDEKLLDLIDLVEERSMKE